MSNSYALCFSRIDVVIIPSYIKRPMLCGTNFLEFPKFLDEIFIMSHLMVTYNIISTNLCK